MKRIIAKDSLPIHYTIINKTYEALDEDEECFKIIDERGRYNWVPRRYFLEFELTDDLEGED